MTDNLSHMTPANMVQSLRQKPVEQGSEWALDRTIRMTDNPSYDPSIHGTEPLTEACGTRVRMGIRHNHLSLE